jgi:TP901 family phage tail tape measure protein
VAETIRGINVVIGADTTKLSKALSDVESKSKSIQSELRQVERLLRFDPSNVTLLAQKQQLLAQQIENTSEKLNRLKSVQQQVADQFARGEISEAQYRAFQREIEKTQGQLNSLQNKLEETNSALSKHTTAWGKLQERLSTVGNNLRDVGQRMQSVGQSMATSMGAAATAIGGALGFVVKKSMDFEAQIDRVGAVAGATPAEIKKLEKAALDLGASTSKSATEVAQAQEIMATMGYKTNEIIAALPGIISAAEASGEDMALVADTVSAALNAFGLEAREASRVADILAQAANDSAASVQDMQYTFKYAAPIARSLGISLEELAAATEIMSNAGIKGEQAGTTLRGGLIQLLKPSEETSKMMEMLGIKIEDSKGNFVGLANLIRNISEALDGQTRAQKLANLAAMVGTEAASGFLTLIEAGPQKIREYTASLENSAGASQEAAAKMKDNLKGSLEELQGAFETAQITIGNALAPAIQKVAGYIQQLVDWFNNLSPSTQKTIATIGAVSAVLAALGAAIGVVLAIIGAAASGIGALTAAFGAVSGAIAAAGGALAVITGPIGLTVAAITALVVAGVALWKNWDTIKAKAIEIWGAIKQWFSTTLESIRQSFNNVWNNIKSFTSSTWQTIKQVTVTVWNGIKSAALAIITPFVNGVTNLFNGMKGGLQQIFNGLKQFFSGVWQAIKNIFLGAVLLIVDLVTGDFKNLSNDTRAIFNNLKNALSSIWNGIKQVFSGAVSAIKGFVGAAWSNIKSTTSSVFNGIRSLASSIWNGIKSAISNAVNTAKSAVSNAFSSMKSAVSSAMSSIKSTITSMWNSAVSFLKGIDLYSIGKNIIQGLARGISSMASAVVDRVRDIANSVTRTIRNVLDIHSPSRETEKLGKHTSEGFAKGIAAKKKDVRKSAKNTAEAAQKAFEEAFKNAQYKFKMGKIDETEYLRQLRALLKQAKTADQTRKVNLEIKRVQDAKAKKDEEMARRLFEQGKQAIEYQKQIRNVSLEQELQWWNNLAKQFKKGTKERMEAEKEYARVKEEITKRNFENEKRWFEEKKYYGQLSLMQELASLNTVAKRYKQGTEERIYWEKEIYRVKMEIYNQLKAVNEEYTQKIEEANKRLAESERQLTEEYQRAVDERAKSLYSFAGLFDEFTAKTDVTGAQLLQNLRDQVKGFEHWQVAIQSLAARGVDKGLIAELQEMGPKALSEIQALTTLSDSELQEFVNLWRQKSSLAREEAVKELADLNAQTQQKIKELREATAKEIETYKAEWTAKIKEITTGTKAEFTSWATSMQAIGNQAIKGLIEGMKGMTGPLQAQAKAIADAVSKTIKSALKIKSPSRVMMDEVGKWIPLGLAEGISKHIDAVVSAANRMAQATIPSVNGLTTGGAVKSIVNNMTNAPITINLTYNGTGSPQDAYDMVDIIERELGRRAMNRLRFGGMRV